MITKQGLLFKFYAPVSKVGIEKVNGVDKFFLEGYAATSDLDRQGEVITLSALKQGAEDLLINHAVFYEHKSDEHPIGKIVKTDVIEGEDSESDKLYVKVYISETAETIRTLIKEGILDKFSIGGKVLRAETEFDEGSQMEVLKIYSMELYEVSVVGLPANVKAESIGYEIHKSFKEGKINKVVDGIPLEAKKEEQMAKEKDVKKTKELSEAQKKDLKLYKEEDATAAKAQKKEEPKAEKKEEKVEKPEVKEEAKKEDKAEKAEAPKEEAKKEAPVEEKKEEPKKKEEEVKPEAEKSKETPKKTEPKKKEEVVEKQDAETPVECPGCGEEVIPVDGKCPECGVEIKSEEVEYYDVADILEALKALQKGMTELLAIAKADKKEEKIEETTKEDIEASVDKAVEKRLKNVRVVPTRKGLIIRDNNEEKLKDKPAGRSPLEVLSDEEGFNKLDKKEQKNTIRGGMLQILKNTKILNDTDDGE